MERSAIFSRRMALPLARGVDVPAVAAWTAAFAIVLYLAASGGGYDPIVHDQVGIAIWWIVLAGAATGVLAIRVGPTAWLGLALLAAFAAWTAAGMTWTESEERTAAELARVTTYLGVLAIGLLAVGGRSGRPMLNGLACAFGSVAGLAVLSRVHPAWFPSNDHAEFLPEALNRLSYPLNSWNGLASFVAMGLPVVIGVVVTARSRIGQATAAAAIPVMSLCIYLTASRGGLICAGVATVAVLVLFADRLATLATLLTTGAGAAILVVAASQRDALERGIPDATARGQGDEMMVLAIVVCVGVGLLQVAIGLVARFVDRPLWMQPTPRRAAVIGVSVAFVVVVGALSAGGAGELRDGWNEFRAVPSELGSMGGSPIASTARDVSDRLTTVSGNGRWQYWQAAVEEMKTHPLRGTGPGTFEFWWARTGNIPGFVRDAHSLYYETLGESGIVGFALLAGLLLLALLGGVVRTFRASAEDRPVLAAAVGAVAVFVVAASADWVWEVAVVPCALMLLLAIVFGSGASHGTQAGATGRVVLAVGGALALVAIAFPLAGASALRQSQTAAGDGRLGDALSAADTAERSQPYAATPPLQRALVLELAEDFPAAVAAARDATGEEPTNWRTWLVRARLESRSGDPVAAVRSFRKARVLNPQSGALAR